MFLWIPHPMWCVHGIYYHLAIALLIIGSCIIRCFCSIALFSSPSSNEIKLLECIYLQLLLPFTACKIHWKEFWTFFCIFCSSIKLKLTPVRPSSTCFKESGDEGPTGLGLSLAWQPPPVFLPENPWKEKPGRLQSMGLQRVVHDWINLACTQWPGTAKSNGQFSAPSSFDQ